MHLNSWVFSSFRLCMAVRILDIRPCSPLRYFHIIALEIRQSHIRGHRLQLCVISRRSRFRAGTRYFRRGIDRNGHVANFNESEQILLVEDPQSPQSDDFISKLSFVQTRGSVPVFWAEINTLRYKPDMQIMDLQETVSIPSSSYSLAAWWRHLGRRNGFTSEGTGAHIWTTEFSQLGKQCRVWKTNQRRLWTSYFSGMHYRVRLSSN
jgi:hypothetical protein